MSLLAPLGLLLGLTLPVVVIFYLLKVRRRDEEVSSTFLWNDLIRDLAAHEPLQKLKWNVLLALQLLLLALLTLALARPFQEHLGERPVHAVLLVDASASMRATDVSPSRFGRAKEEARRTLARLPNESLATVILAAGHPQVLVAGTRDRRRAEQALEQAEPSGAASDLREALLLARSLGGDAATRRIYLFTDNAFTLPLDLPDDLGAVSVTQAADPEAGNVAITAIASRPDPRDNRRRHLFARVQNFASAPASATLSLAVDDQLVQEHPLEIVAGGSAEHVFEELPGGARAASLRLTSDQTPANALELDDQAFSVLAQRKPSQVLLVSPGNAFLEKILTLLPSVELYRVSSRRYLGVEVDRFDVVIFDDYLPPLLPRGNLLIVDPPERGPVRVSGEVRRPRVGDWEREDPLLAYVDVRDLTVNRATRLDLPRWAKPLIVTPDGVPLLAAGQDGERRVALIPFDLRQSNLPLSPAFPILMANLVTYLSPPGVVQQPEIRTGEPETLAPLPQVERVRITAPDGGATEMTAASGPLTYAATDQPGIYRVQQIASGGSESVEEVLFAANLANPDESDLRPRAQDLSSAAGLLEGAQVPLQRELWTWVAALALPLLLFEWFWFHRRV